MELDSKDSEIEQLRQKLVMVNSETASCSSGADFENADGDGGLAAARRLTAGRRRDAEIDRDWDRGVEPESSTGEWDGGPDWNAANALMWYRAGA